MDKTEQTIRQKLASTDSLNRVAESLTDGERVWLLFRALNELKQDVERSKQLSIERKATESVPIVPFKTPTEKEKDHFQEMIDHPERCYRNDEKGAFDLYVGNREARRRFRAYCKQKDVDFENWKKQAIEGADEKYKEWAEADWCDGGVMEFYREKRMGIVISTVTEMAKQIRLAVTKELLETQFSLGDGRKVTWGKATKKDHQERIDLLNKNALANMEASARHMEAIRIIDENKVRNLEQTVKKTQAIGR